MQDSYKKAKLILKDGSTFEGFSFGFEQSASGEVVFNTGMTGYVESLTDPSYKGQIITFTYPMIGNYGVPASEFDEFGIEKFYESEKIHASGLIISDYSEHFSHNDAIKNLSQWLIEHKTPALFGIDTRALTKRLREKGVILGKIIFDNEEIRFSNPNLKNLVAEVSIDKRSVYEPKKINKSTKTVLLVDCGVKNNIIRIFLSRGVRVVRVPWDYDFSKEEYDGLFISNGPGNPKKCKTTIRNIAEAQKNTKPMFGICLGSQLMALASGADTYKLKYGHRGFNQSCIDRDGRCFITSQNHGFAVKENTLSNSWRWKFKNVNDGTNEGVEHKSKPFFAVQFHPEASAGPMDTEFLFDEFIKKL